MQLLSDELIRSSVRNEFMGESGLATDGDVTDDGEAHEGGMRSNAWSSRKRLPGSRSLPPRASRSARRSSRRLSIGSSSSTNGTSMATISNGSLAASRGASTQRLSSSTPTSPARARTESEDGRHGSDADASENDSGTSFRQSHTTTATTRIQVSNLFHLYFLLDEPRCYAIFCLTLCRCAYSVS